MDVKSGLERTLMVLIITITPEEICTLMTTRKSTGIKKHTFRSAYSPGNGNYSELHNDDGLTEQSHASSCDINLILAQFMETGIMPNMKQTTPQYADVTGINFQDI